jgi:hypothetical protein
MGAVGFDLSSFLYTRTNTKRILLQLLPVPAIANEMQFIVTSVHLARRLRSHLSYPVDFHKLPFHERDDPDAGEERDLVRGVPVRDDFDQALRCLVGEAHDVDGPLRSAQRLPAAHLENILQRRPGVSERFVGVVQGVVELLSKIVRIGPVVLPAAYD